MENGPFIVDLPSKANDFPVRYVKLPEGIYIYTGGLDHFLFFHILGIIIPTD